jgi:lipid-A-disaccharide synthase
LAGELLIGMVAGESSGDFLGAQLMAAMKRLRPPGLPLLQFAGIGGPKMQAAGFDSWFPMERLAVRGYVEVLRHYPGLVAMRNRLYRQLLAEKPAVFIGIDAPDFNLDLEARFKSRGVRTVHYVSPSVWAWRAGRIRRIARSVDRLLALFPFEPPLYAKAGVKATYVGHPLADEIPLGDFTQVARDQLRIRAGRRVFALLPGSRQTEVQYLGETFARVARLVHQRLPDAVFLVPLASRETRRQFEQAIYQAGASEVPITILFGHAGEAIAASDTVLVASGTATLETALLGKPMVIAYRMAPLTYKVMSRMHYQPWIGLPNVIAGEFLVPELVQQDATPENLAQALINVSQDPVIRERLPRRFNEMHELLRRDASSRAAEAVFECLAGR